MIEYTGEQYGSDGLNHWREGSGQSFVPNINDPMYVNMTLESMSEEMRWGKSIRTWKTIPQGTMNQIRVKRRDNPMLAVLGELGMNSAPQIKIDHAETLSTLGKDRPFVLPKGLVSRLTLPEGSSRNSIRIPRGGSVFKSNGVIPIGIHDTVTAEEKIFQTFSSISEDLSQMGKIIGAATDTFYRDFMFATAGWRYDWTKFEKGYDSLHSPVLGMLLERVFSNMRAFGAKELSGMTKSFLGYGTIPVKTRGILYIPYEAATSIRMNPNFIKPEQYNNQIVSPEEEGILGGLRVISQYGMELRECGDGRMIADMVIVADDPIIGLRLQGKTGMQFSYVDPELRTKDNIHGRIGAIGVDSWIGALNLHPERIAVISIYINDLGEEDIIKQFQKCNPEPCLVDCVEDKQTYTPKDCEPTCDSKLITALKTSSALEAELAEALARENAIVEADAVDNNADAIVDHVVYPDTVLTAGGNLSTKEDLLKLISDLQGVYVDRIITPTRWIELYPTREADMANFIGTEDGSVQPESQGVQNGI